MKSNTAVRSPARVGQAWRSSSSHSKVAKKLSATALSRASPTVPIEATKPASRSRRPNARLVYWQPWSAWCTRPGGRLALADGHVQGAQDQFGAQMLGHRPAHDPPGEAVQHHGQV